MRIYEDTFTWDLRIILTAVVLGIVYLIVLIPSFLLGIKEIAQLG